MDLFADIYYPEGYNRMAMRYILNLLYLVALVLISPIAIYRMIRQKRYRKGWSNRIGNIKRRSPDKKCIWIHAVSVGEVNATRTVIKELSEKLSDYEIVISTTTDTGFARAAAIYGKKHLVFFFPMDFTFTMNRAFKNIRPNCCLLMELEVWPNFVRTANQFNAPVVVVNGRISDRSFARYSKIKPITRMMFSKISLILSQSKQYTDRFIALSVSSEKVITTGSLKYDTAETNPNTDGVKELKEKLKLTDEPLLVAGGTGNNEEKIILGVFCKLKKLHKDLRLVIVPRKPERFDEVAKLIEATGFGIIRFSQVKANNVEVASGDKSIILGDTMGDLRKFYTIADINFVGRTLVPMGGSDMMEAAASGNCTIFGPHAFNFRQTVDALIQDNGAIMVQNPDQLYETLQKCLSDHDYRETIANKGRDIIIENQGATQKAVEEIVKLIS